MTIQPMATSGNSQSGDTSGNTPAVPSTDINESDFLTLLVAQMKNQDPTNPTDATTFVTQLAQFSQLEQVIAIRGDIESQIGTTQTNTQGGN